MNLHNERHDVRENSSGKNCDTRRIIFQLECLLRATKTNQKVFDALVETIEVLTNQEYSRVWETTRENMRRATAKIVQSGLEKPTQEVFGDIVPPDSRVGLFWHTVQDVKADSELFVSDRTNESAIRRVLCNLEEVLHSQHATGVNTDLILHVQKLINSHLITLNDSNFKMNFADHARIALLQDKLAAAEEIIRNFRQMRDEESKQNSYSFAQPSIPPATVRVALPFARAPLNCDRAVLQPILCFLSDPYPQFCPEEIAAEGCSSPMGPLKCPRGGCTACVREEYRQRASKNLRDVCNRRLTEKSQIDRDTVMNSWTCVISPLLPSFNDDPPAELERFGFVVDDEVRAWEQELYVQWTSGPITKPTLDVISTTTVAQSPGDKKLADACAELEKQKATAKLCVMQMQRVEAALHPTSPVTFPDTQRTPETMEGIPRRLLSIIKGVAELQKECNKHKSSAVSLQERVEELESAFSDAQRRAAAPAAPASSSPSPPATSPSCLLGVNQRHEGGALSEAVDQIENLLSRFITRDSLVQAGNKSQSLSTRLATICDRLQEVFFKQDIAVERLTQELQSTQFLLSETMNQSYRTTKYEVRREQLKEYETQLSEIATVLQEHQFTPRHQGSDINSLVHSGEIPQCMRRMGHAHTAATAAIELMLQEGVESPATKMARDVKVWSADSLDVVSTIQQMVMSHVWPVTKPTVSAKEAQERAEKFQEQPQSQMPNESLSLQAEEKSVSAGSAARLPYRHHLSRKGVIDFTTQPARNQQSPKLSTSRSEHKSFTRDDATAAMNLDWSEEMEAKEAQKMGADSKHFYQTDDNDEEEKEVQRVLQKFFGDQSAEVRQSAQNGSGAPADLAPETITPRAAVEQAGTSSDSVIACEGDTEFVLI